MKSKLIIARAFVCCIALALAGCNSQPGNDSSNAPTTDTVTISGMAFHPAALTVNKGDTVLWINQDIVAHDVTEFPVKEWTSDTLKPSQSWKKAIDQDINYFCSIHPTMKGQVAIKP